VLDLGRLQQLQEFSTINLLPLGSVLPTQLQRLQLGQCQPSFHLAAVMPLQQLTALELQPFFFEFPSNEHKFLLQLTQLTALQQLRLAYTDLDVAAATVSAWGKLPQLCALQCRDHYATEQKLAAVISGLAAATSLTKLSLQVDVRCASDASPQQLADASTAAGEMPGPPVDAYASIARLTRLEHLDLSCSLQRMECVWTQVSHALLVGDVAAPTALTGITSLSLAYGGACVSDAAALALASHMTQLRKLCFQACSLGSMLCLGGVAQLPHLRVLQLKDCTGLSQQRLMLLTRLRRLSVLPRAVASLHLGRVCCRTLTAA
jgi:hypothetical protein